MLYSNHRRPVLRAEHPNLKLFSLSKLIGDEWNKLTVTEKSIWLEKSREQKLDLDIKSGNATKAKGGENETAATEAPKAAADEASQVALSQATEAPALNSSDDDNADAKPQVNGDAKKAPATDHLVSQRSERVADPTSYEI